MKSKVAREILDHLLARMPALVQNNQDAYAALSLAYMPQRAAPLLLYACKCVRACECVALGEALAIMILALRSMGTGDKEFNRN